MSKTIRLLALSVLIVAVQVNLVSYIRIAGVAPDMLIVALTVITTYCGHYGGFCTGSVMALLYDASVGYVLAINLIGYAAIGYFAPVMRKGLDKKLNAIMKHRSVLIMVVVCFVMTLVRETLYIGYLFLIGSEQSVMTIVRALLCSGYNALLVIPVAWIVRPIMTYHPRMKKKSPDLIDENDVTETHR